MAKSKRPRPSFDPAPPPEGDTPWVRRSSPATDEGAGAAPEYSPPPAVVEAAVAAASSTALVVAPVTALVPIVRVRRATAPRPSSDIVATCIDLITTPFTIGVTLALLPLSLLRGRSDRGPA
jgi:hypothetical protein